MFPWVRWTGRGRWPVARPAGTPCGRRVSDGAPGQTPPTAADTRCGRHIASATHAARRVGHASGLTPHTQGGREDVRGVGSLRGTPLVVPGGDTAGRPQRAWRVAVRPRARLRGRAGGAGGPEAERSPQRGTPGPVRRLCRPPGRSTRPTPGVCRGVRTVVRRSSRPPWAWWGARPSPPRGVGLLPGRAAHGARDTGGLAPPGPPAGVGGTPRPAPALVRKRRPGRQTGGHPAGSVSYPCGP